MTQVKTSYVDAIREGFEYLLEHHPEVYTIGQGLWSPWYVGNSMKDLNARFGKERVIDTPVSELAVTAAAVGASICGRRPIVIHPRMDFMVLAADPIVNQAAKWRYLFNGESQAPVTIRSIINRGGEQGAQHSQAMHSWYAHIPGLRVVMPATAADARDLLVAATLTDDPVLYIDDRWLYETEEVLKPVDKDLRLSSIVPQVLRTGSDVTLVGAGWTTKLSLAAAEALQLQGISAEVVDLRQINPLDKTVITASVEKTGRLVAIDGSWSTCGLSAEIIAIASETVSVSAWKAAPRRISLADVPAPTARTLEAAYYPTADMVVQAACKLVSG